MNKTRTCLQCGTALVGRSDKRYCFDSCRHLANNVIKQQNQNERRVLQINAALRKNRSALKQLSPRRARPLSPASTWRWRASTSVISHQVYRTRKGNIYHLCYDYGYMLLPEEKALIVNWQPYMDKQ